MTTRESNDERLAQARSLLRECCLGWTDANLPAIKAWLSVTDETTRELAPSEAASFDKALVRSPRRVEWVFDVKVTVCSECFCASCWQGIFYCDKSKEASTTTKTVGQLRALGPLESPEHWFRSPHTGVVSEMDLSAYHSAVKTTCESSGKIPKEPQ